MITNARNMMKDLMQVELEELLETVLIDSLNLLLMVWILELNELILETNESILELNELILELNESILELNESRDSSNLTCLSFIMSIDFLIFSLVNLKFSWLCFWMSFWSFAKRASIYAFVKT